MGGKVDLSWKRDNDDNLSSKPPPNQLVEFHLRRAGAAVVSVVVGLIMKSTLVNYMLGGPWSSSCFDNSIITKGTNRSDEYFHSISVHYVNNKAKLAIQLNS
jgi:hypothetical protein